MSKTVNMPNGKKAFIRSVQIDRERRFAGDYKGHSIYIYKQDQDYPGYWSIEVKAMDGSYAVDAMEEFDTIDQAIVFAIEGAMLQPE